MSILDPRIWLAFVLALAAAFGVGIYKGDKHGEQSVRVEWQQATADANREAARLERARQSAADGAARVAAAREVRLRADAAGARRDADGVRDASSTALEYAHQSRAAAERTAGLATELLGQCSRALVDVAEAADRADSEARELRQGWPTDSPR